MRQLRPYPCRHQRTRCLSGLRPSEGLFPAQGGKLLIVHTCKSPAPDFGAGLFSWHPWRGATAPWIVKGRSWAHDQLKSGGLGPSLYPLTFMCWRSRRLSQRARRLMAWGSKGSPPLRPIAPFGTAGSERVLCAEKEGGRASDIQPGWMSCSMRGQSEKPPFFPLTQMHNPCFGASLKGEGLSGGSSRLLRRSGDIPSHAKTTPHNRNASLLQLCGAVMIYGDAALLCA